MLILTALTNGIVKEVTVIFIAVVGVIILGNLILLQTISFMLAEYFQIQKIILILKWMPNCYSKDNINFKRFYDNNNTPVLVLDDRQILDFSVTSQSHTCGQTLTISVTIQHRRRSLLMWFCNFWGGGLISFSFSIIKCQYNCPGCIENQQIFCLKWSLHQYSLNQKYITISDGWTFSLNYDHYWYNGDIQFLKFQQIQYQTQLPLHQDVLIRFYKYDEITIIVDYSQGKKTITSGYQLIEILIENHCDSILLLNIKTQIPTEYCLIRDFEVFYSQPEKKIVNKLHEGCLEFIEDKCLVCQDGWTEDRFLENCHPICSDGNIQDQYCHIRDLKVSYTQAEIVVSKLNEGCSMQIDNLCLICKEGWIKDEFLDNCHPFCGDGKIQGQEECDDANLISNDSCYQCKYSCINFCKTCVFGICYECAFGFDLNADLNCVSFCGDGNVVPYSDEQCDLTDNGEWDHCQDCRFISIANCKHQLLSMCLVCELGFQLLENACFPLCGDKYILQQYEECDDGNLRPYDGCFQCKFQCAEDCNICHLGECILRCEDGYNFVNNRCLSICGDQIVTKEEDCDDGNTIQFDGCFNCKYSYSCPQNCNECYQGTCLECNDQYQLLNSNQCK
ncbi:unnamed protein product (macronuclear) [Paramecium tetraurelia]|uniref:TNFR-Cys domain-containing protein n=1 Tax=Paramecium tetraurelia TaxID=5888 RepID=A0CMT0_PARTE|nr:uncharacterized protein GSPATT00038714001 [Paramecium tetraurelia]CAK72097.1 unnamed protein product [Paramecium tetraurelia]|eukprot:XP_001439494.1 hypothetical protein (macronuclear) [Paramecium tetraurelia strain d4-2]